MSWPTMKTSAGTSCKARTLDPTPKEVHLHRVSGYLELTYADGRRSRLPAEYLRVHSPSAEVRGHGPGQSRLVTGKRDVGIDRIEAVGRYALRICFDDGHESGLYTWEYLAELGASQQERWASYLDRLQAEGHTPRPDAGT